MSTVELREPSINGSKQKKGLGLRQLQERFVELLTLLGDEFNDLHDANKTAAWKSHLDCSIAEREAKGLALCRKLE